MRLSLNTDFDKLTAAFERAPEETRKAVRLEVKKAVRDIKEYAREHHRYTTRGGDLERRGIVTRVTDNKGVLALSDAVPYAVFVHQGTKAHIIEPRVKLALRWTNGSHFVFAKRVMHPGTRADPFLFEAADHELPRIQSRFADAIESILRG